MNAQYNSIIFDLGGVVLNLDYNRTINAFKELGKENFDRLYTQSNQDKIFDLFETGSITAAEFRKYMKAFLDDSIPEGAINNAWNAMLLDLPPQRIELLLKLKERYKIFLFSNTNEIHLEAFRNIISDTYGNSHLLETIFHQTYYSHLLGLRKPNIEAFQKILDNHQLIPEQTLFIDDSIQHIEGAQKLGIHTHHLVNQDICELFK